MENNTNILNNISIEAKSIFSLIQKNGPLTKNQLLLMTQMKLTTLNRIMAPLLDNKLIIESDIGESTGGRKPILYDVNPDGFYMIGIDISRIYTRIVVTNLKMNVIRQNQFQMTSTSLPEQTVKMISDIIYNTLNELHIDRSMVFGAGVGTVGPLDRANGIMTHPKNFDAPGWINVPIKSMLEKELGIPVTIDNGANTGVLAEFIFGQGKGFRNIAYFNCGVGIRMGAISSGNIIRTINDVEDAFGHMVIDVDGELCNCGNYGCIECYSSIPSIVEKFKSSLKKGRVSKISKELEEIDYIDICTAAENGDELSRETIVEGAVIFGTGLANYINLVSPQLVILSGPLLKHSNLFYQTSVDVALKKYYLKDESKIIFSKGGYFKDSAMAVGAAAMVVEEILKGKL